MNMGRRDEPVLRLAREDDIPGLEELIPLSVKTLQAEHYSPRQMAAALGPVFGVDRQLIYDGTYFVWEWETSGRLLAAGGWSRRQSVFGGDASRSRNGEDPLLDPARDPARIRAFFVHPEWARRGLGGRLLVACEEAAMTAGFREAVLVATLTGEPLYAAKGYAVLERYEVPLKDGMSLPVVKMGRRLIPKVPNSRAYNAKKRIPRFPGNTFS